MPHRRGRARRLISHDNVSGAYRTEKLLRKSRVPPLDHRNASSSVTVSYLRTRVGGITPTLMPPGSTKAARRVASRPMPRYRHAASKPNQHLAPEQRWPYGELQDGAPPEARLAQALAQRLHQQKTGQKLKDIAERAGITTDALSRLPQGETWGTLPIIARLEKALEADLWGTEHR